MKQSVLFFDIDGTILSDITKQIPQSALEALTQARRNGHLLFVNTGRTWCALPREVKEAPFDGFLCGCGTYLVYRGQVLFSSSIPRKRGVEILGKMEECRIEGVCEGVEDIYYPGYVTRFEELEAAKEHYQARQLGNSSHIEDKDFIYDKLFLFVDDDSREQEFWDFIAGDMDVIDRERRRYEVIQKGYDKATACEFIRTKFGLPLERCYVFGDSSNDLAMFQYAPHAIAMAQHSPLLEPYTEYVTKAVEEDGIAHALAHYGFL